LSTWQLSRPWKLENDDGIDGRADGNWKMMMCRWNAVDAIGARLFRVKGCARTHARTHTNTHTHIHTYTHTHSLSLSLSHTHTHTHKTHTQKH
jgi:hypothetical protein